MTLAPGRSKDDKFSKEYFCTKAHGRYADLSKIKYVIIMFNQTIPNKNNKTKNNIKTSP